MIVYSPLLTWIVSVALIVAAVIDGRQLRVPNWLTFPLALSGLVLAAVLGGPHGLLDALAGLGLGLLLLLPVYAIGGMGAGDVKLLAAEGAWTGCTLLLGSFATAAVLGGVIGLVMIARSGRVFRHIANAQVIVGEILTVRDPVRLSELAAERKPKMLLLPYGIPLTAGSIAFFAYRGLFF
jgi:prepilin peptidase CpaA